MIYLKLFVTFLEIGLFTFGGGYAMISLIREKALANGWLEDAELLNLIAVSESTPGPIAVNMATFVGSSQGGILGSLAATLGVVLPSFIIILIISALIKNFLKYNCVKGFLGGVRPAVVGLIVATGLTMFFENLLKISSFSLPVSPDVKGLIIFAVLALCAALFKAKTKKALSPIMLILVSAVLGAIIYPL